RLQVSRSEPEGVHAMVPPPPPGMQALAEQLAAQGIEVFPLRPASPRAAIAFRLTVDQEDWWVLRTVEGPSGAVSGTLLAWSAVLALATMGALLVSVRLIARPIGQLAQEIGAQGGQQGRLQPLPLRSQDSVEIQSLVHAFNALAHQLSQGAQTRQQLLAGVSHDLRTPLARLRLRAETQCEGALSEALLTDLLALEHIVSQFLAYVQGDSEPFSGPQRPLNAVVHREVQRQVDAGHVLQADLQDLSQPVPELALSRLLGNLIDNARLHGGPPVSVQLRATAAGAAVRVSDGGPGMNASEFERAQQPFVRLTHTRATLGHCGLGLAIVAQLTHQLGGTLQADTSDDGRFGITLTLPAQGKEPGA
ncbi:MAG: ATP-binding protein, partial [Rubrivivax sp.]|nr:ATP-binding protein [Rubrivivax sp.]